MLLPDNPPPIFSDEGAYDAAGDNVMENDDGGPEPNPLSGFTADPIRSAAADGGNSRRSPEKGKSGSKRAASEPTEGAKGEAEVKTAKKKKKKKTLSSFPVADATAAAVAFGPEDSVAPTGTPKGAAVVEEEEIKKSSGSRVFSEEDDIVLLERIIEYQAKTGLKPGSNPTAFFDFVKVSLHAEMSRRQVMDKIRALLRKFRATVDKYKKGKEPDFTPYDSKVFDLSMQIWGMTESNGENPIDSDVQSNHTAASDTLGKRPVTPRLPRHSARKDHKKAGNVEFGNNDESGKVVVQGRLAAEALKSNAVEEGGDGKEAEVVGNTIDGSGKVAVQGRRAAEAPKSNAVEEGGDCKEAEVVVNTIDGIVGEGEVGGGSDADDFWARYVFLRDGVETMASQGLLGDVPKSLLLTMVKGFGWDKGKKWDGNWKSLHIEEMQLLVRKFDLRARFSKAVLDELKKK